MTSRRRLIPLHRLGGRSRRATLALSPRLSQVRDREDLARASRPGAL